MGSKNTYLERQQRQQQTWLDIGEEMGIQKMWDYVQIALRDPELMGKDTFGRQRLEKLYKHLAKIADTFSPAFTGSVEADYWQEKMDDSLRQIWDKDLQTFYERYPYIKKLGYHKAHKGWK